MVAGRNRDFKHLSLMTMGTKWGDFYQARLSAKLGRKTIGLGKHKINALNICLELDEQIEKWLVIGDDIDIDYLKNISQERQAAFKEIKAGNIRVIEKDDLVALWDKYVDFHTTTKAWSETTIYVNIATVTSLINQCPYQKLEQKHDIVNWIFKNENRSTKTSKDRFKRIVSCVDWCSKQGIIPRKWGIEYRDILNSITVKNFSTTRRDADGEIDIFKVAEVYQIIHALKDETYARLKGTHKQYWQYVYFCWLTGCRPSEAIALKWENVDLRTKKIKFCEVRVNASGKIVERQGTKTKPSRQMPINPELELLLKALPSFVKREGLVFRNKNGKPISQQALNDVWRTVLTAMGIRYRVPYQLRHTMISYHANNDFPLHKLATLVGNSEEVIREHYLKLDIEHIHLPGIVQ